MISASLVKELREQTGAGMMDCKKALTECDGNLEAAIDWLREKGIAKAGKKGARIAAEGLADIFIKDNKAVMIEINAETDFVSKNDEFKELIKNVGETILNSDAKTLEEANELPYEEGTIKDLIIAKTSKIGEKLDFRRLEVIEKKDDEVFGQYLHMGGKIAVVTVVKGANEEVAKDVAMQAAAMKPKYVFKEDVPADEVAREKEVLKEQAINEGKSAEIAEKMVEGRLNKFYKEICLSLQAFIKDGDIDVTKYVTDNGGELIGMTMFVVGEGIEKRQDNFAEEVMAQINK
ncbi:MAG TPA: elongation factor Ts [Candidatus Coprovivens excrementavium]|nr:elongation factor Ts [Candidatus Coprovivens excrementavium]